jgi:U3 small nucleolar RNA-associated protein 24
MGKAKTTRKFAAVKRMINPNDARIKEAKEKLEKKKTKDPELEAVRHM